MFKRNLFIATVVLLVSCTQDNPPENDPLDPALVKVDSISTWGIEIGPALCTPFQDFRIPIGYKFSYDSDGDISKVLGGYLAGSLPRAEYRFIYEQINSKKKIRSIYSPGVDSIHFNYRSGGYEYWTTLTNMKRSQYDYPYTTFYYDMYNYGDSMTMYLGRGTNVGPIHHHVMKTKLKINSDGNVTEIIYFRVDPFQLADTAMVIRNTFHTSRPNPYYSIYKKMGAPLLFLLSYTKAGPSYYKVDLAQEISKNCISHSQVKIYNNTSCGLNPGITVKEYEYDLTDYFTFDGKHVTRIRDVAPSYFNKTYTGSINMNATFSFQD